MSVEDQRLKRIIEALEKEPLKVAKKIVPKCVVCGSSLIKDLWFRPFNMYTPIGAPPEKGKHDGWHCGNCGLKYLHAPRRKDDGHSEENIS